MKPRSRQRVPARAVVVGFVILVTVLSGCLSDFPSQELNQRAAQPVVSGADTERIRLTVEGSAIFPATSMQDDPLLAALAAYLPDGLVIIQRVDSLPEHIMFDGRDVSSAGTPSMMVLDANGQVTSTIAMKGTGFRKYADPFFKLDIQWLPTAVHESNHQYQDRLPWYRISKLYANTGQIVVTDPSTGGRQTPVLHAYYFDSARTDLVAMTSLSPARELAARIPVALQGTHFRTYILGDHASQYYGIYGLLDEYSSYYWSMLASLRFFGWFRDHQPRTAVTWMQYVSWLCGDFTSFAELRYWMLEYMALEKEKHPDEYNRIMANAAFRRTFTDMDDDWIALENDVIRFVEKDLPAYAATVGLGYRAVEKENDYGGRKTMDYSIRFVGADGAGATGFFHWHDHRTLVTEMDRPEYRRIADELRIRTAPKLPAADLHLPLEVTLPAGR
jgi:hypothetical protein